LYWIVLLMMRWWRGHFHSYNCLLNFLYSQQLIFVGTPASLYETPYDIVNFSKLSNKKKAQFHFSTWLIWRETRNIWFVSWQFLFARVELELELCTHLSIWGSLLYHGAGSSLNVRCNSKVVTVPASHRTLPMFLPFAMCASLELELWLWLEPPLPVESRLEFEEWRDRGEVEIAGDDLLLLLLLIESSELSKLSRMRQPRRPQGSVSAIRRMSLETRARRSGGKRTSPQERCAFFADRRDSSKCKATDRKVAEASGLAESTSRKG
jgi:hypothetical protein